MEQVNDIVSSKKEDQTDPLMWMWEFLNIKPII